MAWIHDQWKGNMEVVEECAGGLHVPNDKFAGLNPDLSMQTRGTFDLKASLLEERILAVLMLMPGPLVTQPMLLCREGSLCL
jgi:hypothetical protein